MTSTALTHSRELGYAEGTLLKIVKRSARFGFFLKTYIIFHCMQKTLGKNAQHKSSTDRGCTKPTEHKEWTTSEGSHPTPNPSVESCKWRCQSNIEASTGYL